MQDDVSCDENWDTIRLISIGMFEFMHGQSKHSWFFESGIAARRH
jgi:hypothetical protein